MSTLQSVTARLRLVPLVTALEARSGTDRDLARKARQVATTPT